MRDKIINLHSSAITDKETLKKAVINNTSKPDQNILQGEIAVVNTAGSEGIYTLNSDGTDVIEFKPLSKEEKDQISALISAGTKDEVYVGNDEPSGEQELWIDMDAEPSIMQSLVIEAPTDGKIYGRNGQNKTWVDVSNALTGSNTEEVYIGAEAPTGEETVWIDTDETPDFAAMAVPEAPKDDKQYARKNGAWTEVVASGGSSEHTLDLSPLFDSEGSPVATVTDEFLAEVKKAYEGKYSNAAAMGVSIMPMSIHLFGDTYTIRANDNQLSKTTKSMIVSIESNINATTKSAQTSINNIVIDTTGSGTKALTDNGQYAEFASPVKSEDGGTGTVTKELQPNTFYKFGECSSLTITLAAEKSGILNEYMFEFACNPFSATILKSIPGVVWENDEVLVPEAGYKYQVSIVNNMGVYAKFPLSVGILTYTTTGPSQSVQLINMQEYAKKIMLEDETDVPITGTGALNYTFAEAGKHKVYIEFKEDVTDFSDCFSNCTSLTSIPNNLFTNNTAVTSFSQCFFGCTELTSIPVNLFVNNTAVTNFNYCFQGCSRLIGSCPLDSDGTPIYNRSGSGKSSYAIVTSYSDCFYNCTGLTDYSSIPDDWK